MIRFSKRENIFADHNGLKNAKIAYLGEDIFLVRIVRFLYFIWFYTSNEMNS